MTQRNKLIIGAVVVLVAYYLYDRNKKMKSVSELKTEVQEKPELMTPQPRTDVGSMRGAPIVVEKM